MNDIAVAVDLRPSFGAARDQGPRPTCLAFAASDAHAGLRPGWTPLSCEFAFCHAQRRAGRSPGQGALLPAMLETLRKDGQPTETGWPYLTAVPPDLASWTPPAAVGVLFGRDGKRTTASVDDVIAKLDAGRPVIVLLMLSAHDTGQWYKDKPRDREDNDQKQQRDRCPYCLPAARRYRH